MELFRKVRLAKSRLEKWFRALLEKSQNPFWLIDKFLIVGATRFTPRTRWQRLGWILYRLLTCPQPFIALVCFISAVICKEDLKSIIQMMAIFVTFSMSLVKQRLLLQHFCGNLEHRNFLVTPGFCSGDPDFDESVRKRFKRASRIIIIAINSILTVQQVVSWIPSEPRDLIFRMPPWITLYWGENVSSAIKSWYISICFITWGVKLYGCTVTAVILMVGFKAEQTILAHSFGQIENDLQELRQNYWDCELARKQYWERLRTLVRICYDRQQLLLRHLNKLQSFVQPLFFFIYYGTMFLFGSDLLIILADPSVFMFVAGIGMVTSSCLECYSLCYLVDSLKDIFESISGHMLYLSARLPYSEDHHGEYREMRTTLQIIAICSRNAVSFECAGVSEISVVVFAEMLNTCYSVLTFLREVV